MPPKNANMQKITAICEKTAERLGYELCDAAIEKEPTGRYLRIYIDRDGGITLDDCETYHRAVQPGLESFDYDFLEVCSPGIDRPLKTKRDVEKSIGLLVEARLYKPVDGKKVIEGLLKAMDDDHVVLTVGGEEETDVDLPRKVVSQVRLVPDLSALDEAEDEFE
ncbi:MAG: ribosome maturation factor RimP [Clostridia bacterium]|nr:ribosome maturation factor RimP [Clostridia bacterium]